MGHQECAAVIRFVAGAVGTGCNVSPIVAASGVLVRTHFVPFRGEGIVGAEVVLAHGCPNPRAIQLPRNPVGGVSFVVVGKHVLRAPLYLFEKFFVGKATEHLLGEGIKPEHLNDDRLGRILDKLHAKGLTELDQQTLIDGDSEDSMSGKKICNNQDLEANVGSDNNRSPKTELKPKQRSHKSSTEPRLCQRKFYEECPSSAIRDTIYRTHLSSFP